MPYVKCSKCMHEWETTNLKEKCRWCKAPIGNVLEEETPQYHLYCFQDPNLRFPFGMWSNGPARATPEHAEKLGGKQRPFEKGEK